MSKEELKTKIKEVMVKHLKSKGYPNMTPEQIMQELKPMWIAIEEAGLIRQGMSFQAFVMEAQHAYQFHHINMHFRR